MRRSPFVTATAVIFVMAFRSAAADPGPAQHPPLIPPQVTSALAAEISGASARRTVQELTLHHRMRGSRGYAAAAEAILRRAREWGLQDAEIISLPADGKIFYGTQRSRPAWNATFAELWTMKDGAPARRIADWDARPVTLAQDSASGSATTRLVDIGAGTEPGDYEGKMVHGNFVLTSSQPGAVASLAVERHGAAGIISYAQNQRSAWWGEDETLVRWGHLDTFDSPSTFAFMVSLKQARIWKGRLAEGEEVRLKAEVRAGREPGAYLIPTARIPGSDPKLREREIAFSCHLDHQRPGANDNASGCAAILEAGRALAALVASGEIEPPGRTIRFFWPPEIEGTIALLNARPEIARRTDAVIHMDMVGGDPAITKAVFHVTRSPRSLPTFVNDVAEAIGRFVNAQTAAHAGGSEVPYPLVDPEGGKEALLAEMADFTMGSDHHVWTEGSFRVPAIYLNDWPDRYIHTHRDAVDNIDATKLKRAAFIGAAAAWYLSRLGEEDVPDLMKVIGRHAMERRARAMERAEAVGGVSIGEGRTILQLQAMWEREVAHSVERFAAVSPVTGARHSRVLDSLVRATSPAVIADSLGEGPAAGSTGAILYSRNPEPRGPMRGFGYSYREHHRKKLDLQRPALLDYRGLWGAGSEYAYEALNLVDGGRSVGEIRDELTATYGPVPLELVAGYLDLLEKIGILSRP